MSSPFIPVAPAAMPRVHSSIVSMLDHSCEHWGTRQALMFGEKSLRYEELRSCVLGLARYKIPSHVEQRNVLPKTSINKTDKKVLKALDN